MSMADPVTTADAFVHHLTSVNLVTLTLRFSNLSSDNDTTFSSSAAATPTTSTCTTPTCHNNPLDASTSPSENNEDFTIAVHASLLASLTTLVSGGRPETLVFESEEHKDISVDGLKALAEFAYLGTYTTRSLLQDMKAWATASALKVDGLRAIARERIKQLEGADCKDIKEVTEYAFLVLGGRPPAGGDDELFRSLAGIAAWRLDDLRKLGHEWLEWMVESCPRFAGMLLRYIQPAAGPPSSSGPLDSQPRMETVDPDGKSYPPTSTGQGGDAAVFSSDESLGQTQGLEDEKLCQVAQNSDCVYECELCTSIKSTLAQMSTLYPRRRNNRTARSMAIGDLVLAKLEPSH